MIGPPRPWLASRDRAAARGMAEYTGVAAGALILTLIAWWPAVHGWFLLDDFRWLLPSDRRFDVLRSFVGSWGHFYAYRPLMRVSFLADLHLFGWDARGWHLHNLLLHAGNVTLLFALIRAATGLRAPALAAAALFAVSPIAHENVAWISGRTFLLGAAFFLLSANLLVRAVQTADAVRGARLFWSGTAAFVAAMASYEPTVVLPLLALLTVRCFPSIAVVPPTEVRRRVWQLFLVLGLFLACRFVFLKGRAGLVGPSSPYWIYEPIKYYVQTFVLTGQTLRIITPLLIAAAFVASFVLVRWQALRVPSAARHLHVWLAAAGFILFLPFINVSAFADRFFYLIQTIAISTIVFLLWLIARSSRAGVMLAATATLLLTIAGAAECRQSARDWSEAGAVSRAIADEVKRLYPVWPDGVDVVLDRVPRYIGRAPLYVLYTKESVLQRYDDVKGIDAEVYFGEELAAKRVERVRPARYFRFDVRTRRLTEWSVMEWEQAHARHER